MAEESAAAPPSPMSSAGRHRKRSIRDETDGCFVEGLPGERDFLGLDGRTPESSRQSGRSTNGAMMHPARKASRRAESIGVRCLGNARSTGSSWAANQSTAATLRVRDDIKQFYLGVGSEGRARFRGATKSELRAV